MTRSTPHKEGSATVQIVYKKDKRLTDGTCPFVVRITKNRERKYVSTGLSLHPDYWNEKRAEIRRTYPANLRLALQSQLDEWQERYMQAVQKLTEAGLPYDAEAVKQAVAENRYRAGQGLVTYTRHYARQLQDAQQLGNAAVYRSLANRLDAYLGNPALPVPKPGAPPVDYAGLTGRKDMPLAAVNLTFLNRLERWMRSQGNSENTMHNRFRALRTIINIAIAEGDLDIKQYPFARSRHERQGKFSLLRFSRETEKRAISRAEIARIDAYRPVGTHTLEADGSYWKWKNEHEVTWLDMARRVFLFSYYAAGINFVDLAQLRWKDLRYQPDTHEWRLRYTRQKTNVKFNFVLVPEALALIEPFRALRDHDRLEYVFPLLNRTKHKTLAQITARLKDCLDKRINPKLKVIGAATGIDELTTYVARHSMATHLRQEGVSDAMIAQIMGHADEKTTTIYLDEFSNPEVDHAISTLRNRPATHE